MTAAPFTHPGWDRYTPGADPALDRVLALRFGRNHERPCRRPQTLTCAAWACQRAGGCQDGVAGTVSQERRA